ncbi:MAG: peptidase M15 [Candidatus Riflebacteria bacterium]|nr:peptidase M15 [Candidatus Riflebacteria bacterium]
MIMSHFNLSEFTCKCGCGQNNISPAFVAKLNIARDIAGVPFHINSGCRCDKHNAAEGGKSDSSHLTGFASDIAVKDDGERSIILNALIKAGFTRFGMGKTFIHTDKERFQDLGLLK